LAAGPRQCIGNAFALMEASADSLADVCAEISAAVVANHRVEPLASIKNLRARYGVRVTLERRRTSNVRDRAMARNPLSRD